MTPPNKAELLRLIGEILNDYMASDPYDAQAAVYDDPRVIKALEDAQSLLTEYREGCVVPVEQAFEETIVKPLRGRYDEKQRTADFAMFSLGYRAAAPQVSAQPATQEGGREEREGFYEKMWNDFVSLQRGDVQQICAEAEAYRRLLAQPSPSVQVGDTPTPRTDAVVAQLIPHFNTNKLIDLCVELERELTEQTEQLEEVAKEAGKLRSENERLERDIFAYAAALQSKPESELVELATRLAHEAGIAMGYADSQHPQDDADYWVEGGRDEVHDEIIKNTILDAVALTTQPKVAAPSGMGKE